MTAGIESIALNPVEFVPERTEVDLHSLGLEVKKEGLDYGETSAEVERVRQAIGEGITDRRWPSVDCTIPLLARGSDTVPLAEALNRVEATVSETQQHGGGWIRRDFSLDGGFSGSVAAPIDNASISPPQGWEMAHLQFVPDYVLKLSRGPIWYATVETAGTLVKGTEVRDLKWEISNMLGTAPGLIRVRIKNEGAVDWRGLMAWIESDDYSPAVTAEPVYECEALTPLGGASVVEKAGASNGKVVEHATLGASWLAILESKISGIGHMTHVGLRRLKMRVFDPSAATGMVQLRLESRALGASSWETNKVVEAPLVGNWAIVDLGECRPERAVVGSQKWEWRVTARAPGGSGAIRLDRVWLEAAEQRAVVATPKRSFPPDHLSPKFPGTVINEAGPGGKVNWTSPANAKASDGAYAVAVVSSGQISNYLWATNFGFAIPGTATIVGVSVNVKRLAAGGVGLAIRDSWIRVIKGGEASESANRSNPFTLWPAVAAVSSYGGSNDLWNLSLTPADINAANFGAAIAAWEGGSGSASEAKVDSIEITVYYTEAIDENKVCFASRSVELATDGLRRQHPTEDVWGRLTQESGALPYAPGGGLEARTVRGLIVPSQGDLGILPDAGNQKLNAQPFHRPGYLAAREAA